MAIIGSLFALLGRFVGKALTTTLGWASVLLFGRVPQDRQIWLAVLTFGSLAWVVAVIGILLPDLGTVLLAAVPRPDWIPEDYVRLAMLAIALILPAILGGVTLLLFEPEDRPKGAGLVTQVLRGYPLAPTLATTLVVLAVAGTIRKLSSVVHRREDAHISIVVRPGRYDPLVDTLEQTLQENKLIDHRGKGSTVLVLPARILAAIAGRGIGRYVPDKLEVLEGRQLRSPSIPPISRSRAARTRLRGHGHSWRARSPRTTRGSRRRASRRRSRTGWPPSRRPIRRPGRPPCRSSTGSSWTSSSTRTPSRCSTGAGCSSRCRTSSTSTTPRSRTLRPRRRPRTSRRHPRQASSAAGSRSVTRSGSVLPRSRPWTSSSPRGWGVGAPRGRSIDNWRHEPASSRATRVGVSMTAHRETHRS